MRSVPDIFNRLKGIYTLDARALAFMRIGVALLLMTDLVIRGIDIDAFYTNDGIWPLNVIQHSGWKNGYWSIHMLSGSKSFQILLFVLSFILSIFLLVGFKTRVVSLFLFLLTISLHNRNLFIQQAGDDLLRLTLLWGIFLPWANVYSIDSKTKIRQQFTIPVIGYLLLLASLYFFTAMLKSGSDWNSDHLAIYYALALEQLRLVPGDFLYEHIALSKILTTAVYCTEFALPLLILAPLRKQQNRAIAFVIIVLLHIGIAVNLYVGLFWIISIVVSIGLIPTVTLDHFAKKISWLKKSQHVLVEKNKIDALYIIPSGILIICLSLMINVSVFNWFPFRLNYKTESFANVFRLDQYWGMFSPNVLRKDGWFVYHGMDTVGRQWDLRLNQDHVDYKKPKRIVNMYKSDRWRKLAENMQDDRFTFLRPLYCKYYLKQWNKEHPEKKMRVMNLYFMEKINGPDFSDYQPEKKLYSVCDVE